ncbi:MAG: EVE domain-containing protein [Myxococcota bacterium]
MARAFWLAKSEPGSYAWTDLEKDGDTYWDGVRNYQARNNLQAMKQGDLVLFYHSQKDPGVVGVARVTRTAYPDPTSEDERWVVVDFEPVVELESPVSLQEIKADRRLWEMPLLRQPRLSVVPVEREDFNRILSLGKTKLPRRSS